MTPPVTLNHVGGGNVLRALLFRFFCTIYLTFFCAIGSESWYTLCLIFTCGLIADALRNAVSPECRTRRGDWTRLASSDVFDQDKSMSIVSKKWQSLKVFWIAWVIFIFGFMMFVIPHETTRLDLVTSMLEPVIFILSPVSRVIRSFPVELAAHGYPNRANVAGDFYALNYFFCALNLAITCSGLAKPSIVVSLHKYLYGNLGSEIQKKILYCIIGIAAICVMTYCFANEVSWIRWDGADRHDGWNVSLSNTSFEWYGLLMVGFSVCSTILYVMISTNYVVKSCIKFPKGL